MKRRTAREQTTPPEAAAHAMDGGPAKAVNRTAAGWLEVYVLGVALVDVLVYSLALPLFPRVLGASVSDNHWLWAQGAANLAAALSGSLVGWLSDLVGRKPVLSGAQLVALVCSLMMAAGAATDGAEPGQAALTLLLAAFVLRKVDRTFPLCCALVTDLCADAAERAPRLRHLGAVFGIGFALGPAAAGALSGALAAPQLFLLGGACAFLNLVAVAALFPSQAQAAASAGAAPAHAVSWREVAASCSDPAVAAVLLVHMVACLAQFTYITSIGIAARDRFAMDTRAYGLLVSYFGVTYSAALLAAVPTLARRADSAEGLGPFGSGQAALLRFGLALTAASRFAAAFLSDQRALFAVHTLVSLGTASINFVLTSLIAEKGRAAGITGSLTGVQDSIQRASGVAAPLLLSAIPTGTLENAFGDMYVGGFVSGVFYAMALAMACGPGLRSVDATLDVPYVAKKR